MKNSLYCFMVICLTLITSLEARERGRSFCTDSGRAKDGQDGIPNYFEDGEDGKNGNDGKNGQNGGHGGAGGDSMYGNGGNGGNGGDAD